MNYSRQQRLQIYIWSLNNIEKVYEFGMCHVFSLAVEALYGHYHQPFQTLLPSLYEFWRQKPGGAKIWQYWWEFNTAGNLARQQVLRKCVEQVSGNGPGPNLSSNLDSV